MPQPASGARIEPVSPPYAPALEQALERSIPAWRDTGPLLLARVWARHPPLGQEIASVAGFLLGRGQVDAPDRELLILRTCALAGAEYEWGVHADGYAPRSGLSESTIEATACRPTDDPAWSEQERLLVRLVDQVETSTDVSDPLWSELASIWTEAQLLELLLITGFYRFIALAVRATRTPLEDWARRFPSQRLSSR